ncbi:alpha/beta-hydrolases superfamily protein [Anaeramoeba flamelloides]|uniref:Alpha/beta-hydrolases superfamily protein n=1 Tax=Anaeramoeba flamelloides TaxID=1746091 RepID=A0AAV7Y879_9EUKA|nr:alpha/beta-hydrolases superfamily protein [Anaeramoeba flamelloides]
MFRYFSTPKKRLHLFLSVNGFGGHHTGVLPLCNEIERVGSQQDQVTVQSETSKVNNRARSFYGIDVSGNRLKNEVKKIIGDKQDFDISFLGHSMGGLVVRYAIWALSQEGWFEKHNAKPKNFVTICTPHLGTTQYSKVFLFNFVFNNLVQHLNKTSSQFMVKDDQKLLLRMSQPDFVKTLEQFPNRVLFGNSRFDWRVPFYSSLMIPKNQELIQFLKKEKYDEKKPVIKPFNLKQDMLDNKSKNKNKNKNKNENEDDIGYEFIKEWFPKDTSQEKMLKQMVINLNSITWNRYAILPPQGGFWYKFNLHNSQMRDEWYWENISEQYVKSFVTKIQF